LERGPVTIRGISNNASGLTWNKETKSLFLVINGPCLMLELEPTGKVIRTIELKGFSDTEGIAYTRNGHFYIAEEGRGRICSIRIVKDTRLVDYKEASFWTVDSSHMGNKGLEGLCYDPGKHRIFGVKERNPRKVYETVPTKLAPKVSYPWDIEKSSLGLSDLSGIFYDSGSGHLLILSHESSRLTETTLDGKEISHLSLKGGPAGLKRGVPQAEGVTMDEDGNLYICSEPNLLYVFKRKAE